MRSAMAWSWNSAAMALARRHLGAVAAIIALPFAISGIAAAEPSYSFDSSPGKLPKTVIPVHYAIELTPDLESLALPGVEIINMGGREPTARLVLNAVDTTFGVASIDDGAQSAEIALDATAQTATLSFAQPIAAGAHRLRIAFTARINKFGTGLFSVDYPTDNGMKRLAFRTLPPARARRAF